MRNILYKDIADELTDRLDNSTAPQGAVGEFLRQKKTSDIVIARAVTAGMYQVLRSITHTNVPDLVNTVALTKVREFSNVFSFAFPDNAVAEREDNGIISFVIGNEELDWSFNQPYQVVLTKASMMGYNGRDNVFHADPIKRRLYIAGKDAASAIIVQQPRSAFAAVQGMFSSAWIVIELGLGTTGTIVLIDGIGGELEILINGGWANTTRRQAIVDAVNAAEDFAYNAVVGVEDSANFVRLYARYDIPTDIKLAPEITETDGTGTYSITDKGTYELPVPYSYMNELTRLSFAALMDDMQAQPQPQADEST